MINKPLYLLLKGSREEGALTVRSHMVADGAYLGFKPHIKHSRKRACSLADLVHFNSELDSKEPLLEEVLIKGGCSLANFQNLS